VSLEIGALIFVIIACVLTGVVLLSALAEWRLGEKTPALVRACSLTSTCRSLFNTRKHPRDISCLHGLRVGSMLWIILGHHYGYEFGSPISNPDIFPKVMNLNKLQKNSACNLTLLFSFSPVLSKPTNFNSCKWNARC
jgi:hypothetical protein